MYTDIKEMFDAMESYMKTKKNYSCLPCDGAGELGYTTFNSYDADNEDMKTFSISLGNYAVSFNNLDETKKQCMKSADGRKIIAYAMEAVSRNS